MEDARTIPQRSHSTRGFSVSDEPETLTQASPSSVDRGATLRRQEFLASVVEQLRIELPEDLAGFQVKAMSQLVKIYYGNERVHYEFWISANREFTEVGLHFED